MASGRFATVAYVIFEGRSSAGSVLRQRRAETSFDVDVNWMVFAIGGGPSHHILLYYLITLIRGRPLRDPDLRNRAAPRARDLVLIKGGRRGYLFSERC